MAFINKLLGLPSMTGPMPELDLEGYPGRCDAIVDAMARNCGLDQAAELKRFHQFRETLGADLDQRSSDNLMGQLSQMIGTLLPSVFEFCFAITKDGPHSFYYCTQGRHGGSCEEKLLGLLGQLIRFHVETGGATTDSELIADLFRAAYPNPNLLSEHSVTARGITAGAAPVGEALRYKLFMNTRLYPVGNHRDRIVEIYRLCGLEDLSSYDTLYNEGCSFQNLGVDLDLGGKRRVKLYVRLKRDRLPSILTSVATALGWSDQKEEIIESSEKLFSALSGGPVADDTELVVAHCAGEAPRLRVSALFGGSSVGPDDTGRIETYLAGLGFPRDSATAAIEAGVGDLDNEQQRPYPLHAVSVDLPTNAASKVNIYLMPAI